MQAINETFQAICIGKQTCKNVSNFQILDATISSESHLNLLGIEIDSLSNFDIHISNVYKKSARQINLLTRLCPLLNLDAKILICKSFI
jgi:hypothetical protein